MARTAGSGFWQAWVREHTRQLRNICARYESVSGIARALTEITGCYCSRSTARRIRHLMEVS